MCAMVRSRVWSVCVTRCADNNSVHALRARSADCIVHGNRNASGEIGMWCWLVLVAVSVFGECRASC